MLFLDFSIPEDNIWWRTKYYPYKNKDIFVRINTISKDVTHTNTLSSNKLYCAYYILNTLKGEKNICETTSIDNVLEQLQQLSLTAKTTNNVSQKNRNFIKIQNMYNALMYIFNNYKTHSLSIDFIKNIHCIVSKDLLYDRSYCGKFRNVQCSSLSNQDYYYEFVKYTDIDNNLNILLDVTNTAIMYNYTNDLEMQIKIGAQFYVDFLNIHPFINCNGRVARLLLSFILYNMCNKIPICILCADNASIYSSCLDEVRFVNYTNQPKLFCALILESILHCMEFYKNY